jgi:predicted ATPase
MITSVKLSGAKSFSSKTSLACAPITVLTGSNSCGKSTILKCVLLQKQLVEVPVGQFSIVRMGGPLVSQGSFQDWSWAHLAAPIGLGLDFESSSGLRTSLRIELEQGGKAPSDARLRRIVWDVSKPVESARAAFRLEAVIPSEQTQAQEISNLWGSNEQPVSNETAAVALTPTEEYPYSFRATAGTGANSYPLPDSLCSLSGLLPASIFDENRSHNPMFWLIRNLQNAKLGNEEAFADLVEPSHLRDAVGAIHYLGPLRDEPRLVYGGHRARDAYDVGLRGEGAASVLAEFGDIVIDAPYQDLRRGHRGQSLIDAVSEWAERIGVAGGLDVSRDRYGTVMRVEAAFAGEDDAAEGIQADVLNVGIGVSQVLPVLILCLAAPPDSTVLLEQPELHLHPAVQSRLGDFFAACALSGRQMIIETHSEHLINRFRLLVAKGQLLGGQDLCLNFVERDKFGSELTEIPIHADGSLGRWPNGFFDESQSALKALMDERMK